MNQPSQPKHSSGGEHRQKCDGPADCGSSFPGRKTMNLSKTSRPTTMRARTAPAVPGAICSPLVKDRSSSRPSWIDADRRVRKLDSIQNQRFPRRIIGSTIKPMTKEVSNSKQATSPARESVGGGGLVLCLDAIGADRSRTRLSVASNSARVLRRAGVMLQHAAEEFLAVDLADCVTAPLLGIDRFDRRQDRIAFALPLVKQKKKL